MRILKDFLIVEIKYLGYCFKYSIDKDRHSIYLTIGKNIYKIILIANLK